MVTAALALVGVFVALYLLLWKVGAIGSLACAPGGGCETVQTSEYSDFLGLPVSLYGAIGFVAMFAVSLAGLQPRWLDRRTPTAALVGLSGVGVVFSAYLTYLEAAVIHAWCQWCIGSAIIVTGVFVTSLVGLVTWPAERATSG
jgi:uncharacterized membrane protein